MTGEIIGGSQREDDLERLSFRAEEMGLPEDSIAWYLDLRCGQHFYMLLCLPVCFSKCGFMYSDRFTAGPFHVVVGQRRLILEDILSVNQSYCRQSCWGFVVPG